MCKLKFFPVAQPVKAGFPSGFNLPVHAPVGGTFSERMDAAAAELRAFCGAIRRALKPRVALHERAADRLQAECVLGALMAVRPHTSLSDADVTAIGEAWLAALGIAGDEFLPASHALEHSAAQPAFRLVMVT